MASRKEAKEAARQRRIEAEAAAKAAADRKRRLGLLGGMVVLVVVVVGVTIAVASGGGKKHGLLKPGPKQQQTVAQVNSLLAGVPQNGTTLGSPSAPVTLAYFGDLECPICADFTTSGGFPQLVADQVKTGKVKVVYHSFCTATCNQSNGQSIFNTQQAAAYSAGLQKKFWNYAELFYREQGTEDTHYADSAYLQGLAAQAGVDQASWKSGLKNPQVVSQVNTDQQLASKMGLTGTPTLIFTGPTGKKAQPSSSVPSYSDLVSAIKSVS